MTQQEFAEHLEQMQQEEVITRSAGQKEYAHEDTNAFRNFEALASELNLPREVVLWVYLKKHMDGVLAYINGHRSQRESIHGRIKDARLYLALLDGMFTEDESRDGTEGLRPITSDPSLDQLIESLHQFVYGPAGHSTADSKLIEFATGLWQQKQLYASQEPVR